MSSGKTWVYRFRVFQSECPEMAATSCTSSPFSNNREMASCLKSWKRKSLIPASRQDRLNALVIASAVRLNGPSSSIRCALFVSGIVLALSVFVSGMCNKPLSLCSGLIFAISPRRMAVSRANRITRLWGEAFIKRLNSPGFSLLILWFPGLSVLVTDRISLATATGFSGSLMPHNALQVFITCDSVPSSFRIVSESIPAFRRVSTYPITISGERLARECFPNSRDRILILDASRLAEAFRGVISCWYFLRTSATVSFLSNPLIRPCAISSSFFLAHSWHIALVRKVLYSGLWPFLATRTSQFPERVFLYVAILWFYCGDHASIANNQRVTTHFDGLLRGRSHVRIVFGAPVKSITYLDFRPQNSTTIYPIKPHEIPRVSTPPHFVSVVFIVVRL